MDGAWKASHTSAGIAWVCMDQHGQIVHQRAQVVNQLPSPTAAEAMACLEALSRARSTGKTSLHLLTDCQVLVNILNSKGTKLDWQIMSIVYDICNYCKDFDYICISKVGRNVV
ncbi:unnamed protein product [Camellia sinensis]